MLPCSATRRICLPPIAIVLLLVNAAAQEAGVRGRRVNAPPAAEATVTVNEQFLNSFLDGIFDNLHEPSMPLVIGGKTPSGSTGSSSTGNGCGSEITLKRELNGTRTAVHFEQGHIAGPLAFTGSYSSTLMGCIQFSGWANAEIELAYERDRQALVARFHLREIHLNDVPTIANGPLLNLVQTAIDTKYNPLELFTLEQVSSRVNLPPAGGALQLRATEIRPEITPNGLTLHIFYEFVKG
jgi:hypothetical protein